MKFLFFLALLTFPLTAFAQEAYLAAPDEIELGPSIRREYMSSSVGRIDLRWPRSAERLFGRTPERAMADAARAVSRALRRGGFPPQLNNLQIEWNVVFMDENMPPRQIPIYLLTNCHPGWMTPPANIYIASTRAAAGCGPSSGTSTEVADSQLAQLLIHEMAHVIEHELLQESFGGDRMRAEGFASWFEYYAAGSSSIIDASKIDEQQKQLAIQHFNHSPDTFRFAGSPHDYARASMYFRAVVDRRGVTGLMDVYKIIKEKKVDFLTAVKESLYWSNERLHQEARRMAE